jgi:hypothetical protein
MAARSSSDSPGPQALDDDRQVSGSGDDLRVLVHQPELCMVDARGVILLLLLTAMRTELLAEVQAAHIETATRHGGPRPLIALCKLDRRFPLDIGFNQNLGELRSALDRARPVLQACAVIVGFGGILGFTMHQALRLIGLVSSRKPPMRVCSTATEAVCWIEPYAASSATGGFDRTYYLSALRRLEVLLGSY